MPSTSALSVQPVPLTLKVTLTFVGGALVSLNFTVTVIGCATFSFALVLPLAPVPVLKVPALTV